MSDVIVEKKDDSKSQSNDDVQSLKDKIAALEKEKLGWSSEKDKTSKDLGLNEKVKIEREDQERKSSHSKSLETALTFNLTSGDFLKTNGQFLPKDVEGIFKAADKEIYETAVHKANATKSAIVQEFFKLQANMDLLTNGHKNVLADYLKLTKNGKEEKADEVYQNIFEPALELIKRVKKAEELEKSKHGLVNSTDSDQAYKDKLSQMAEKKFFRGKNA